MRRSVKLNRPGGCPVPQRAAAQADGGRAPLGSRPLGAPSRCGGRDLDLRACCEPWAQSARAVRVG